MRAKNLKDWKDKVLERDNSLCRDCGGTRNLLAHHIKSQYLYIHLKLEVENGMALCRKCHHKRKEFALGFWHRPIAKGYLPKMPTAEEVRAKAQLLERLSLIPPQLRGTAFHSHPYKIRLRQGQYYVTVPKMWLDRELDTLGINIREFAKRFEPKWTYRLGLPYLRFIEI